MNTDLLWFACPLGNPGLSLLPGLVECEQPCLSSSLDELIGLADEFGGENPAWELGIRGDGVGLWVP